jgi:hypothetical protein
VTDWASWHEAYDDPSSSLSARLSHAPAAPAALPGERIFTFRART